MKFSSKGKISILIFVLGLVFVLGAIGIGLLATRIYDPLWNPFRPKPEEVLKKMALEMSKIKSAESKTNLSISLIDEEGKINFNLVSKGKTDYSQKTPNSEGDFSLSVKILPKIGMGPKFFLGGETKQIGEKVFFKLTTLPEIPELETIGVDLSQIKNQWIMIDQTSTLNIFKKGGLGLTPKMKEEMEKQKRIQKKIEEFFKKEKLVGEKLFVVKKEFPDEKINGIDVYHYLVSLDNEKAIKLIVKILKKMEEIMSREYGAGFAFEEKEIKNNLRNFFSKIGEINAEIWIGKKDYLLYKIKSQKTINTQIFGGENVKISIELLIENSNFNKPVKILAPQNYKTIDEILGPFFKTFYEAQIKPQKRTQTRTQESLIRASMNQIMTIAQLLAVEEHSFENLCKNFRLNKNHPIYGDYFEALEKDIRKTQGGILKLSCYSSKKSFCVAVNLPYPQKGKYCIDAFGRLVKIGSNLDCIGKGTDKSPYRCPVPKMGEKKFLMKKHSSFFFSASILESFLRLFR